ncbi:MAG TPA: dihydrodipicolinate synthase family protein [Sphaerochaeta sp.]|nr:dihydrodipicolinate synthase family protein [Sphaerochaeta sp.]
MHDHTRALALLKQGVVIPATPLAITEDRAFDSKTQRLLMRYYLACGVGGIATAVHSTQFAIRNPEYGLFEPVIRLVSEEIDAYEKKTGLCIVKICGACGPTGQAVREAKMAKSLGYDAVLLSPGGLDHLSEGELVERTEEVSEILPVIGFYLQSAVGGRVFSYGYWQKIAEIPNLVAIKCASFNRYSTLEVMRAVASSSRSKEITMYTGNDDNIVADLLTVYEFLTPQGPIRKGFEGGLLGHWCVWAKPAVELLNSLKEAKKSGHIPSELLSLGAAVTDMNAAVFDPKNNFAGCIPGIHEVLRRQGLFQNRLCLDTEEVLSAGQMEELDRVITAYPTLVDDSFIHENLATWMQGL